MHSAMSRSERHLSRQMAMYACGVCMGGRSLREFGLTEAPERRKALMSSNLAQSPSQVPIVLPNELPQPFCDLVKPRSPTFFAEPRQPARHTLAHQHVGLAYLRLCQPLAHAERTVVVSRQNQKRSTGRTFL